MTKEEYKKIHSTCSISAVYTKEIAKIARIAKSKQTTDNYRNYPTELKYVLQKNICDHEYIKTHQKGSISKF